MARVIRIGLRAIHPAPYPMLQLCTGVKGGNEQNLRIEGLMKVGGVVPKKCVSIRDSSSYLPLSSSCHLLKVLTIGVMVLQLFTFLEFGWCWG